MKWNEIIFVYNANSGIFAAASDFVKKLTQPSAYDCNLCMVTYGAVAMKNPWKDYLDTLPYQKTFLHKDEFTARYPSSNEQLPAVFSKSDSTETLHVLLTAFEINSVKNLPDLITLLSTKLETS
jgi:hypothetical protein